MCTLPATRFWQLGLGDPLSAIILSILLIAGCDTTDPGTDTSEEDTSGGVTSTAITVQSDTLALPGTLLVPDTSATVPGVVLVHGSGPVDRNGQDPQGRLPPIYKDWAERMARRGIAVLRYDKRTTQPEPQQNPSALAFLDFVRDAVAAGELLRNREEVDGDRIVFVGHSQGGNVAPAAATRLGNAAGVASLAGPALAIDSLIVAQLEASPNTPDSVAQAARTQFDSLRADPHPADRLLSIGGTRASVAFFRQWIRHSERIDSVAAALDPPILAQQGRADPNYPGKTLERTLAGWRRVADDGDATLMTYDGVDHRFLAAGTDSTATAPMNDLIEWIHDR